jgi:hypothetical protein
MKILAFCGNVGALYNKTYKNIQLMYKLTLFLFGLAILHSDCSPLLSLVALLQVQKV